MWNTGCLDYSEFANILVTDVNVDYFAKNKEKCKILGFLLDQVVENLDDHDSPKI